MPLVRASTVSSGTCKRRSIESACRRCALQFCLRGPRNVRLVAIWAADENVVFLFNAAIVRYAKLRLKHRLAMQEQARAA